MARFFLHTGYQSFFALALITLLLATGCGGGGSGTAGLLSAQNNGSDARQATLSEAIRAIQVLPAPTDMDAALFDKLRDELVYVLLATGRDKFVSAAPAVAHTYIEDLRIHANPDGSADLSWTHSNRGDYNQDGEVNIGDLSIVGAFYLRNSTSPDWSRARVADGDGNGEVNVADIAPIGQNFLSIVSEYNVFETTTPQDPGSWQLLGTLAVADGQMPAGTTIRSFGFGLAAPQSGTSFGVAAGGISQSGPNSNVVGFSSSLAETVQNVLATQGSLKEQIDITWDGMDGALQFQVHRSDTEDGTYTMISQTLGDVMTVSDVNVLPGAHYWYQVRALLTDGYSPYSAAAEGWALETPGTPTGLTATDGAFDDHVELLWNVVENAVTYQVNRGTALAGPFSLLGLSDTNHFIDDTTDYGKAYYYTVQAINPNGSSNATAAELGFAGDLGEAPDIISVGPLTGDEGVIATFSAVLEGNAPETFNWAFGGLAPASAEENPEVLLALPGSYSCSLTVQNKWGSDVFYFTLTVDAQNTSITSVSPTSGLEGSDVTFNAVKTGSAALSWAWDFGGGATPNTAAIKSPTVTLGVPGTYACSVTATTADGSDTRNFSLVVTSAEPDIVSVSPMIGNEGDMLTLSAMNNGGPATSWSWDFTGAATPATSMLASPQITLGTSGVHNCEVTATNAKGSSTFPFTLTVKPPAPEITAVTPLSGVAGTSKTFVLTNIGGDIDTWSWYFGGGTTDNSSFEESPMRNLTSTPGQYECSVVGTNGTGSSLFQFTLTVTGPVPEVTAVTPSSGNSGADITPSPTFTGTADSWLWDFGGGAIPNTSTEESPTISLGVSGTYAASVTASNASGSNTYNFDLVVNPALPNIIAVNPSQAYVGQQTNFDVVNSGGVGTSWLWTFTGGWATPSTSTSESPTVTLTNTPGDYSVKVKVTNSAGSDEKSFIISVGEAPPDITAVTPPGGPTLGLVAFSATNAGGPITSWAWDFGEAGTPSTFGGESPSITLTNVAGSYSCSLLVTNAAGQDNFPFTVEVAVDPIIISVSPLEAISAQNGIQFSASVSGAPTGYSWNFGGGASPNTSTQATPTVNMTPHTSGSDVTYSCNLTVTNVGGSDDFPFTLTLHPRVPTVTAAGPASGISGASYNPSITAYTGGAPLDTKCSWNFGGGATPNTSTALSPTVTLGAVGTYTVTVRGGNDAPTLGPPHQYTLTINPQAPDITAVSPLTGVKNTNIEFSATNSGGAVATWDWNFPGGTVNDDSIANPTVSWTSSGNKNCSVTVTNVTGDDTFNFTVNVTDS